MLGTAGLPRGVAPVPTSGLPIVLLNMLDNVANETLFLNTRWMMQHYH